MELTEPQLLPLNATKDSGQVLDESKNSTGSITLGTNNVSEPLEVQYGPADFYLKGALGLPLGSVIDDE